MPSKKSKPTAIPSSRSKAGRTSFNEAELSVWISKWAEELGERHRRGQSLPRIALIGPMGAGKSTTARNLLDALAISREAEGSPTFAIAHEYRTANGLRVLHADGYRLGSEAELEATGLLEPLWQSEVLCLFEWMDSFPSVRAALSRSEFPYWEIEFGFDPDGDPGRREIRLSRRD